MKILVTGFAGFIGSNLTRMLLDQGHEVVGLDSFTYAARKDWVYEHHHGEDQLKVVHCDITNKEMVSYYLSEHRPDHIIHLAAESHVCRSIETPLKFFHTNLMGTAIMLQCALEYWGRGTDNVFHHVSTDEVYGELDLNPLEKFHELKAYAPRSPYAASKAASDHAVMSYFHTYQMNTRITNCSNNFGPNQHEEKLIPKAITKMMNREPMTLYGDGKQIRDWLWVDEHCEGIITSLQNGDPGETYCIGGECEKTNIEIIMEVREAIKEVFGDLGELEMQFTNDRPTDDKRYAIDCSKTKSLGWTPRPDLLHDRLVETVKWYKERIFK